MKVKDKLLKEGINPETANIAQIWSAIGEPESAFNFKRSEVGSELAGLVGFEHISRKKLADDLGWKESRVSRVLSGKENLTLKSIFEIADALGYQFDVVYRKEKERRPLQPWNRTAIKRDIIKLHAELNNCLGKVKTQSAEIEAMLNTAKDISRLQFTLGKAYARPSKSGTVAANENTFSNETFAASA